MFFAQPLGLVYGLLNYTFLFMEGLFWYSYICGFYCKENYFGLLGTYVELYILMIGVISLFLLTVTQVFMCDQVLLLVGGLNFRLSKSIHV